SLTGIAGAFAAWEGIINAGIRLYVRALDFVLAHRGSVIGGAFCLLVIIIVLLVPSMRRDFFPEVDSGAFEIAVRAPSGTRIENTEQIIKKVDLFVRDTIPKKDLQIVIAELGVSSDWSAAYTPNSGPMDAVVKVQLNEHRAHSAEEYIRLLRQGFKTHPNFAGLDFSFDSGGLVRGALNEGKSSPINIQIVGKKQKPLFILADMILESVGSGKVRGVADARKLQRDNAPELRIVVDRTAASNLGLSQEDIMKNVIAATNSSATFNKKNIWFDNRGGNQYYVGVQFPSKEFQSKDDILNIQVTSPKQGKSIPLSLVASIVDGNVPTDVHHVNFQPALDLTMNVEGVDLGHVSNDVAEVLDQFGKRNRAGSWTPYDPAYLVRDKDGFTYSNPRAPEGAEPKYLEGSKLILTGEYTRMQDTFKYMGFFLVLAAVLIYFLMVALDKSFLAPLSVMMIVPLCLIGILPMLWLTGSAINVQSMLGFIFIVGIQVANTVLMTDYAQELRRHEGLSAVEAIRKAAALRVRPITMTALAAFFAMLPTALSLERGGEANAPLARAILGGLIAGEPATLFVLPAIYAFLFRDKKPAREHHVEAHPPTQLI
ncbi:MAG TPA: efflux RND transporter permease subunit, partial [Gemmataceae bacterium]|nr:efflux RND transporter permease subunit [Gemmataceae bacterium]